MRKARGPIAAIFVACATLASSHAVAGDSLSPTTVYSGGDFAPRSQYYDLGSVIPIFRDLPSTQVLLRGYGSYNHYDYGVGPKINADALQGDAMLGYQVESTRVTMAAFAGVDFQNVNLSPNDPTNPAKGFEAGFKVAAETEANSDSPFYFNLEGEYSTAFSSYWARARIGYQNEFFKFGPEASVDGSVGYDLQRLGGFATLKLKSVIHAPAQLTLSAGHQFVNGSGSGADVSFGGGAGTYGTISVGFDY